MEIDIEHLGPSQEIDDGNMDHHPDDHEELAPVAAFGSCLCSSFRIIFKALKYPAPAVRATGFLVLSPFLVACLVLNILLSPLGLMMLLSLPKKWLFKVDVSSTTTTTTSEGMMPGIYQQSTSQESIVDRIMMGSYSLLARFGLLLLIWLSLNSQIPSLERLTLLGLPLWRWSLLGVTITAGYFPAMMFYLTPKLYPQARKVALERRQKLKVKFQLPSTKVVKVVSHEHLYIGLFPSTCLAIYFGVILLSWLLYFRTEHGLKHVSSPHPEAFEYVTWTCVSLFVGSVLLFSKKLFLLKWSANAIYHRFEPRISITGVKYVYLGLIIGGFFEKKIISKLELLEEYARQSEPAKFSFINYIMSKKLGTSHLQESGRFLVSLAKIVKQLKEDGVPELVVFSQNKITKSDEKCELDELLKLMTYTDNPGPSRSAKYRYNLVASVLSESEPEPFLSEEDHYKIANILYNIVKEQSGSDEFTFDDLKKWMVDAHKNCVNMGRTLADARAMVTTLDIFISFVICVAVVLLWLLLTGIATTKVLVTIATPFLALTFIFGDSAKAFFQGLIFCFATHAFDVGDRCVLDDTELEVKSIGILTTTFIKVGTTEKRMYPNSVLATKSIVNLGCKPDPTDVVELTLDFSTTSTDLQKLEGRLKQFFNDPQQKQFFEKSHEVMMKEIGDKIKVAVHFTHVLNIHEMTHGQCFHKKIRQRSTLLKKINHFLDHKSPNENHVNNGGSQISSPVLVRSQLAP